MKELVFCILALQSCTWGKSAEVSELRWITNPETLRVLEGTTVELSWQHTSRDPVYADWSYLGTKLRPRRRTIMIINDQSSDVSSTQNCAKYGHQRDRLACDLRPGNATMRLRSVTSSDAGRYEILISRDRPMDMFEEIRSVTALEILYASVFEYNLTVDGEIYQLELDHTGPLFNRHITLPRRMNITVKVDPSAPVPRIRIGKTVGESQEYEPVCDGHFCHRYVRFCSDDIPDGQGSVRGQVWIEIDFGVQNLPVQRHVAELIISPRVPFPGNSQGPAEISQHAQRANARSITPPGVDAKRATPPTDDGMNHGLHDDDQDIGDDGRQFSSVTYIEPSHSSNDPRTPRLRGETAAPSGDENVNLDDILGRILLHRPRFRWTNHRYDEN